MSWLSSYINTIASS